MRPTAGRFSMWLALGVGVALAALALVLALSVVARPGDAATKIVTKTFSKAGQVTIPAGAPGTSVGAADPYPSEKNVGGFKRGKILDVNVKLKLFGHSYPDDVDVMLSHRGVNRTVMSDVGGSYEVNDRTLRLNDEAATFLPGADALSAGGFRPTNLGGADTFPAPAPVPTQLAPLSGFDGKNPNGSWKLWAMDDEFLETGLFAGGWSITIKARVRS